MIDNINSPKHYELEGLNMESIDIIKAALKENFEYFCLGNVLKYLIRAENKNGVEDYKKARKYLSWIEKTIKVDKDELAKDLSTDWLTIVTCICKNLEAEKALLLDRTFKSIFEGDIETAIIYLDKIIKM